MPTLFQTLLFTVVGSGLESFALAELASCQPGWDWASNSLNQDPCHIAGALDAACQGFSEYVVNMLPPQNVYMAPRKNSTEATCECNTVMYSLFMACTTCQGSQFQSWDTWIANCDQIFVTQFPSDIPQGTAVPNWAYLNISASGYFDTGLAQDAGDLPEALPQQPSVVSLPATLLTSMGISNPSGTSSISVVPSASCSSSNSSGPLSSSNTDLIVIGVLSGSILLVLIASLIACCLVRKRRMSATQKTFYPNNNALSSHLLQPEMMNYNRSDKNLPSQISHRRMYG